MDRPNASLTSRRSGRQGLDGRLDSSNSASLERDFAPRAEEAFGLDVDWGSLGDFDMNAVCSSLSRSWNSS
jgi:hypothetical protein